MAREKEKQAKQTPTAKTEKAPKVKKSAEKAVASSPKTVKAKATPVAAKKAQAPATKAVASRARKDKTAVKSPKSATQKVLKAQDAAIQTAEALPKDPAQKTRPAAASSARPEKQSGFQAPLQKRQGRSASSTLLSSNWGMVGVALVGLAFLVTIWPDHGRKQAAKELKASKTAIEQEVETFETGNDVFVPEATLPQTPLAFEEAPEASTSSETSAATVEKMPPPTLLQQQIHAFGKMFTEINERLSLQERHVRQLRSEMDVLRSGKTLLLPLMAQVESAYGRGGADAVSKLNDLRHLLQIVLSGEEAEKLDTFTADVLNTTGSSGPLTLFQLYSAAQRLWFMGAPTAAELRVLEESEPLSDSWRGRLSQWVTVKKQEVVLLGDDGAAWKNDMAALLDTLAAGRVQEALNLTLGNTSLARDLRLDMLQQDMQTYLEQQAAFNRLNNAVMVVISE